MGTAELSELTKQSFLPLNVRGLRISTSRCVSGRKTWVKNQTFPSSDNSRQSEPFCRSSPSMYLSKSSLGLLFLEERTWRVRQSRSLDENRSRRASLRESKYSLSLSESERKSDSAGAAKCRASSTSAVSLVSRIRRRSRCSLHFANQRSKFSVSYPWNRLGLIVSERLGEVFLSISCAASVQRFYWRFSSKLLCLKSAREWESMFVLVKSYSLKLLLEKNAVVFTSFSF